MAGFFDGYVVNDLCVTVCPMKTGRVDFHCFPAGNIGFLMMAKNACS
jgi:hypothetical protein